MTAVPGFMAGTRQIGNRITEQQNNRTTEQQNNRTTGNYTVTDIKKA
jgi:hypothetical protein